MAIIRLRVLECIEREGELFDDRIRITVLTPEVVHVPGANAGHEMGPGDTWQVDREVGFEHLVRVQLWDLDRLSDPDFLGERSWSVAEGPLQGEPFHFNGPGGTDDWNFTLSVDVEV